MTFAQSTVFISLLSIEIALLLVCWQRGRTPSAAMMIMGYIIAAQCIFLLARTGVLDEYLARFQHRSFDAIPLKVLLLYFALFCVVFTSTLFIRNDGSVGRGAFDEMRVFAAKAASLRFGIAVLTFSYSAVIINAVFIKPNIVWESTQYLLMTGPDAYSASSRMAMILKVLMQLSGIVLSLAAPIIVLSGRRYVLGLLMLLPWAAIFFYQLGAHSRFAAVMLALSVATASLLVPRYRVLTFALGSALVFVCLMFALEGRGLWIHGIGAIGITLDHLLNNASKGAVVHTIFNFMEGVFATGDGIMLSASYPDQYKILSFSPGLSMFDHFDKWLACCEIRLNEYTPMSAIAEVFHFGGGYLFLAGCFLFFMTRFCHWQMVKGGGMAAISLNLLAFVYFVIANSYPVRNVFRVMLAVLIVSLVLRALRGRRIVLRRHSNNDHRHQGLSRTTALPGPVLP